jgi:hypothetical protein
MLSPDEVVSGGIDVSTSLAGIPWSYSALSAPANGDFSDFRFITL